MLNPKFQGESMINRNQFLTLALLASCFGLLGGGLSNFYFGEKAEAQSSNTIIADRFILSQEGTNYGAELGYDDEGLPNFFITDDNGKKRILIGLDKGGMSFFTFYDPFNDKERLSIYTAFDGAPFVQLNDKNGSPRSILGMGEEENVLLMFYDKQARPVWLVPKIFKKSRKKNG